MVVEELIALLRAGVARRPGGIIKTPGMTIAKNKNKRVSMLADMHMSTSSPFGSSPASATQRGSASSISRRELSKSAGRVREQALFETPLAGSHTSRTPRDRCSSTFTFGIGGEFHRSAGEGIRSDGRRDSRSDGRRDSRGEGRTAGRVHAHELGSSSSIPSFVDREWRTPGGSGGAGGVVLAPRSSGGSSTETRLTAEGGADGVASAGGSASGTRHVQVRRSVEGASARGKGVGCSVGGDGGGGAPGSRATPLTPPSSKVMVKRRTSAMGSGSGF